MVSFDVESLHTSIPLEKTIKITLQKIYDQREIKTNSREIIERTDIVMHKRLIL